jgi:Helix-turn-helix domain
MRGRTQINATFQVGDGPEIKVTGREAQTVIALVEAGPKGITSLETFKAGWAVRLGAYVFDLRGFGVPIETTREPHDGGNHARYRLTGPVTLLSVEGQDSQMMEREAA